MLARMALDHVVLGFVASGVRHGYAIWRRLDDPTGTTVRVQRSHVYATLAALQRRRLVVPSQPPPGDRRGRRAFEATDEGRAWLRSWLDREPCDPPVLLQRTLLLKCVVRSRLGERPSRRGLAAECRARRAAGEGDDATDALVRLLRERARRHADVELWLLDRLAAAPPQATRSRSGSASR